MEPWGDTVHDVVWTTAILWSLSAAVWLGEGRELPKLSGTVLKGGDSCCIGDEVWVVIVAT